jgi:nicotinamide-nucleotide adenylyltransferase
MVEEILACIANENIKYLHSGKISKYIFPMKRGEAHDKKISHLIVRLFVVSFVNGEYLYLVQKRGKQKVGFPNYFTDSASGHVRFKPKLNLNDIKKEAKRELEEEFGVPPNSLEKLIFYNLKAEEHEDNTEIAYIFIGLMKNIKILPNPLELDVNHSRFYTKTELRELLKNEKYVDHSKQIWEFLTKLDLKNFFNPLESKKKDKIALYIGRFQPLHHGHIYVLRAILKKHKKFKIGIGSSQASYTLSNPFTGIERKKFINAALTVRNIPSNRFKIYEITDIFNASEWVNHVISIVGGFDIVYSNSDWVRQLFYKKGYQTGKKIGIFKKKYNGTNVRKLIYKNNKEWKRLVPKEVANLIIEMNGIERIQDYYKAEKET